MPMQLRLRSADRIAGAMALRRSSRALSSFLDRRPANFQALSPLTFLERTASVFPSHTAIVYDDWKGRVGSSAPPSLSQTWAETYSRVTKLASALSNLGIQRGDTVAILSPNTPAFVEAHHGVNAVGGVFNPLNTRLDASTLAYILDHSDCKVLLADTSFAATTRTALDELAASRGPSSPPLPTVVDLVDPIESHAAAAGGATVGELTYEQLLATGTDDFTWLLPEDEWESQALNYTSGTTGRPKVLITTEPAQTSLASHAPSLTFYHVRPPPPGRPQGVLYHHRGAALNAINNALIMGLEQHPRYLWTLPMFHCNGWCFPYTITMQVRPSIESAPFSSPPKPFSRAPRMRTRCRPAPTCAYGRRTRPRSSRRSDRRCVLSSNPLFVPDQTLLSRASQFPLRSARRACRTCAARRW